MKRKPATHLLTVPDAAARANVSERTMWRYVRRKKIRVMRFSPRVVRIRPADLESFFEKFSCGVIA